MPSRRQPLIMRDKNAKPAAFKNCSKHLEVCTCRSRDKAGLRSGQTGHVSSSSPFHAERAKVLCGDFLILGLWDRPTFRKHGGLRIHTIPYCKPDYPIFASYSDGGRDGKLCAKVR